MDRLLHRWNLQYNVASPNQYHRYDASLLQFELNDFLEWCVYGFDFFSLIGLKTDAFSDPDDSLFPLAVLQSVGRALTYVPIQKLTHNNLRARFIASQKTNLPDGLQTLLNTFCPQLLFKARPLQITAYHLLNK